MKLDYEYLKQILTKMEECPTHRIQSGVLLEDLNTNEIDRDKFFGHIRILFDFGCIDCPDEDLGIQYMLNGNVFCTSAPYRLTAKGYEFLDILKNKTVFNKIKDFAISNAWDIGKQLLITLAMK